MTRQTSPRFQEKVFTTTLARKSYKGLLTILDFGSGIRDYGEYRNKSLHDEPRAKIQVFCPPLLQYIQFALALAPPDDGLKTCGFDVVIHPDNRLLDRGIYSTEEGHESLSQLYDFIYSNAESGEPIDGFMLGMERERLCRYLATRFD